MHSNLIQSFTIFIKPVCDSCHTNYIFSFAATHSVLTYGSNFHLRLASMAVNFLVSLSDPLFVVSQHPPIIKASFTSQNMRSPWASIQSSTVEQWRNGYMFITALMIPLQDSFTLNSAQFSLLLKLSFITFIAFLLNIISVEGKKKVMRSSV